MTKIEIINKYGNNDKDTGNTSVQIALLTDKINHLTEHLKIHKKDFASRLGLMKAVGSRKRFLNYLKSKDINKYTSLTDELNIRK
jgi:small subunit ribosomal protein S15